MKDSNKQQNEFQVKLITLGEIEVGKTCLVKRYFEGEFYRNNNITIGVDFGVRNLKIGDIDLAINIFDFSGDNDYKSIRETFYQDALGVLMVFDVNNKTTFDSLNKWEQEAISSGLDLKSCVVILVGNKVDIKNRREVNTQVAKDWAKSKNYSYYEASAKSSLNVSESFEYLFKALYTKTKENKSKYLY